MSSSALFTLQCAESVSTGVCFLRDSAPPPTETDSDNDTDSGESVSAGSFRCSNLLPQRGHSCADVVQTSSDGEKLSQFYQQASHLSASSHEALKGYTLASCHGDGSCKLWDLATRRCIEEDICKENRKAGLAVRRLGSGNSNSFLYQSRDRLGTVSLHHSQHPSTPVVTMPTYSTSFCTMSPCQTECAGSSASNLVALPTADHSVAIVRDIRCNPEGNPAWRVDLTVGRKGAAAPYGRFGMATSLALCEHASTIVLGAGMEDGSALFHDLGAVGNGRRPWYVGEEALNDYGMEATRVGEEDWCSCAVSLGKDPVLSIDLVPPPKAADDPKQVLSAGSLVAVGGCAGDELSRQDDALGTVSTVTVTLAGDATMPMEASIRVRSRTCSIKSGGKSGVSVCRFRPDSKMFAVGGWDYRLRLFSRSKSKAFAILRGHEKSVTSCDWADDASVSGLLATCADDGRICVWRVV